MPANSVQITLGFGALVTIIVFGVAIAVSQVIARAQLATLLRAISGYVALPRLQGRSIETGQGLHVSLGTAGIGGSDTVATLAGLTALETIADEAVASDSPPTITVCDPTTMVLAQDALRRAYTRQQNLANYDLHSVRFVAASPMPYAAAVMTILGQEETAASVMVGAFGPEAALMVEEGAQRGMAQIVGTSDIAALPLLYPSSDHLLVGEEMFVSGAYVGAKRAHLSSVIVQDVFRWLLVAAIFSSAVARVMGR
jgi:hypothetical protein